MKRLVAVCIAFAALMGCTGSPHPEVRPEQGETGAAAAAAASASAPRHALHDESVTQTIERHRRNGIGIRSLGGRAYTITDIGEVPTGEAEIVIRDLTPAALAGDGKSSYSIHLKIRECIGMMRRFDIRGAAAVDASTHKNCGSLPAETYEASAEWLDRAAAQGHLGAQLLYAADPEATLGGPSEMLRQPEKIGPYKEKARGYLDSAASQGSVEALIGLGDAYWFGALTERNPALGLAYYRAVEMVDPNFVSQASMEVLKKQLSQKEIDFSRTKGMQIHEECCRAR